MRKATVAAAWALAASVPAWGQAGYPTLPIPRPSVPAAPRLSPSLLRPILPAAGPAAPSAPGQTAAAPAMPSGGSLALPVLQWGPLTLPTLTLGVLRPMPTPPPTLAGPAAGSADLEPAGYREAPPSPGAMAVPSPARAPAEAYGPAQGPTAGAEAPGLGSLALQTLSLPAVALAVAGLPVLDIALPLPPAQVAPVVLARTPLPYTVVDPALPLSPAAALPTRVLANERVLVPGPLLAYEPPVLPALTLAYSPPALPSPVIAIGERGGEARPPEVSRLLQYSAEAPLQSSLNTVYSFLGLGIMPRY